MHEQSLRGGTFEDQVLVANIANCKTDKNLNCNLGWNTCTRVNEDCDGQCRWIGSQNNGECVVSNRRPNRSPTRRPTRRPSSNRNCRGNSNQNSCERNDCEWLNGRCDFPCSSYNRNSCPSRCDLTNSGCRAPVTRTVCSDYDNSVSRCKDNGCWYNSNRCQLNCPIFDGKGRSTCEKSGLCSYSGGQCDITNCEDLDGTSRTECAVNTGNICVWSGNNSAQCDFRNSERQEEEDVTEEVEQEE